MSAKVLELVTVAGEVRAREIVRALPPGMRSAGARVMAAHLEGDDLSGFEARVLATQVDLIELIDNGLPPVAYLPESDGMLVRGKRHLIAAPRKEGKSLAMLVHWVRMALAGSRVLLLDRENGRGTYAERLEAIVTTWGLTKAQKAVLRKNLLYFEFPRIRPGDGRALVELARGADAVVFDAQRMFLTDLGLREGEADDYAEFMAYTVEPLFQAGVATVILDNTGHANQDRSRGTSAKGDLNEVLFTLKTESEFSRHRQGRVRLILEPGNSRFGNEGVWEMHLGGGAFGTWRRVGGDGEPQDDPKFRRAAVEVLKAAGNAGLSQTKLLQAIREANVTFVNQAGRARLYEYAGNSSVPIQMFPGERPGKPSMFFYTGPVAE